MDSKEVVALKAFKSHVLQYQGLVEQIEADTVEQLTSNRIAWAQFLTLLGNVLEDPTALREFSDHDRRLLGPMFVFGSWKIANYVIDARIKAAERNEDA